MLSCRGNQKTADFTEQYRCTPPVLSCDDGDGPRLLLAHLQDLEFGQQGTLVNIRILPEGLPGYLEPGVEVQVARRKAVWAAALATSGANATTGGAG